RFYFISNRRGRMTGILAMATAIAAVTLGVVEAVKRTKKVKKRYMPLVAIVIGMLIGAAAVFLDVGIVERLWAGGISGLAATGMFELGKKDKVNDSTK